MSSLTSGAKIVLECLQREKVEIIFGYPGGVTLPLYDAMYDSPIKHVLVRHEQNAAFAAQGYARATGKVGVCCATSGPGATNLVTGLVDAMMDSIPIVALTGQVTSKLIGSDAFQEADTFGITRSATKHNFLVKNLADLPQAMHEAFHIASTGRPGPVLVDITKDVFQAPGALCARFDDSSAGLQSLYRRPRRTDPPRRANDLGSEASFRLRRRRHHRRRCERGTARAGRTDRRARRLHADGPRRLARHASEFRQHARHARQLCREHGHDRDRCSDRARRALRRSRHRPPRRIRAARESDSRRYRPGGNRQDPHAGDSRSSAM